MPAAAAPTERARSPERRLLRRIMEGARTAATRAGPPVTAGIVGWVLVFLLLAIVAALLIGGCRSGTCL